MRVMCASVCREGWSADLVRDGALLPVHGHTQLRAGDMVTLLIDGDLPDGVTEMFTGP